MDRRHLGNVRDFYLLDAAIEWAEDQVVYRYGGAIDFHETTELSEQPLLAGLTPEELADLASLGTIRTYQAGERIVAAGEPATSLFFLRSGAVHVTPARRRPAGDADRGHGVRRNGAAGTHRSADVLADMAADRL